MPELPEVQSLINSLGHGDADTPSILNLTIADARIFWQKTIAEPDVPLFTNLICNQSIIQLNRRGKFLHFVLSDLHLLLHLRMSGDLQMENPTGLDNTTPERKHDRVHLNFTNGWRLVFIDPRKFGRMWLVEDPQVIFGNLGPEPLSQDFTSQQFYEMLSGYHRQIKPLLLDQRFLAGLGNIYTDESLFLACIHPLRSSDDLSVQEADTLLNSIRQTLNQAIINNGTSIDWIYRGGNYQSKLNVYQQTGKACKVCGCPIERISVGQRGTHYCPVCQPIIHQK